MWYTPRLSRMSRATIRGQQTRRYTLLALPADGSMSIATFMSLLCREHRQSRLSGIGRASSSGWQTRPHRLHRRVAGPQIPPQYGPPQRRALLTGDCGAKVVPSCYRIYSSNLSNSDQTPSGLPPIVANDRETEEDRGQVDRTPNKGGRHYERGSTQGEMDAVQR